MKTLYAPMGVEKLPEKTMLRAIDWYDSLASWDKAIQDKSLIAFEFLTNVSAWLVYIPQMKAKLTIV